ncbi:PREDICTED: putative F-box/kelch-repeat protein At3g17570 isoform X2 [Camelina sativa]|uniref:F-box/kelch-repeat protein At3g17570 isoform X2 n=1 Tax=Camelina sativa TaxID=90675 RepID=A0ABM0W534_CAMSA|nr:PREDICTED: putative F-box/kelch-repeat protein At3g17570 isoform X2 [Camelina sativa]
MMFSDLPRDLQSEILSRVPARYLQLLKPTCKRWYTLFKDPGFLKKNLSRAERGFLFLLNSRVCSISINLPGIHDSVDPSFDVTGVLVSKNDPEDVKISDIFQCDGLLLCTTTNRRLVVWNPYTGQTRWIPNRSSNAMCHKFVLGYEKEKESWNSHLILRYKSFSLSPVGAEFDIYEFNSDSWRSFHDVSPICTLQSKGVSLKGNTYWIASDTEDPFGKFVLRFDFTTKKFGRLSLPFQTDDADGVVESMILSVVREEKLALLYERFDDDTEDPSEMKIWVTNTKIEEAKDLSWSDFLVVDFHKLMVTRMTNVRSFLVDEEKKMVVFCDTDSNYRTRVYVVGENVYQEVYEETTTDELFCYWPCLVSYAPSLVQIQQGQVNTGCKRKR